MNIRFPVLQTFLGGFFHQDWCDRHSDPESVVVAIREGARPTQLAAMIDELNEIIDLKLPDARLREVFVHQIGCYFEPSGFGINYEEFTRYLRDSLSRPIV